MVGSKIVRLFRTCALAIVAIAAAVPAAVAHGTSHDDLPPGRVRIRAYNGADGLRNLVITSIAQDANGFLWIATDDGVYRFDGERFSHFSLDSGLTSSAAAVIAIRADGAACVGSRYGLGCWNGRRFSQETRGLPSAPIVTMVSFGGKLWIGTQGEGLYVQDADGLSHPAPGWHARPRVAALWADAGGIVASDGATIHISSGDGAWQELGDIGIGDQISAVLRDRQGGLWIRTPSHLWQLPRGATRAIDRSDGLPPGYDLVGVPNGMAIGPRGEVLVGTDRGLAYRDGDHWHVLDSSAGLPVGAARSLFVDDEGTVWIGSVGLIQLRGRGIIEHYTPASGLPGNIVWGSRRDAHGTLWLGTNRCLARAVAGRWECWGGTEGRVVRAFVFPPQGGVFAGGAPADLQYIAPSGRASSLGAFDEADDRTILSLALGPEGDLWIGTSAGLFRLPGAVPGPFQRVSIPGVPPGARFASLTVADRQLWTATDDGVLVHEDGAWHLFSKPAGFRAAAMRRVIRRASGTMCASYSEAIGVACFRYRDGVVSELTHIGPTEGLTTGMAYFLGEDREQRLWIGTGDGVDVVTEDGIDHFDESDGLAGNDSAATAFMVDHDGSLWLGSTGGATHVFAQYYGGPPHPPRTTILDGMLGDRPLGATTAALEVPHDRNALNLEFASSSMLDPKRVSYLMRLWPQETEWTATHGERRVRYPALPPGPYRFEIRAKVGAGPLGPITQMKFSVLPAWWQTPWFFAVSVMIGLAAIGAGFTWRQRAVLRRRTRQLHARSDASFRAVIDQMPDLMSVHRDGKMIYLNKASRRFLGLGPKDHWDDLDLNARIHPDDLGPVTDMFRRVGNLDATASPEVIEMRMRGADGNWRICEVSAVLVEIGGAITLVSSARDVTERKRMRAKLLVTDRMASLGTLAAGIAHEINNPLAYVTGNLEAMAEALQAHANNPEAERAELTTAVHEARDGAERVRKIVQGLRSFSRSEQEEKRVPLALAGVLEAAIRLTANEVRHRAQLVREIGPVPLVIADDGRLTQVFINLLVNAAHAIPEGRSDQNRITLRTRTDEQGRAVIEVEDTGKGIAPEVQSRVFDPFFTTKDVGEGTGLGLSICHGIISSLGGQISIESTPSRGTVVRVVLPAHGEAQPSALPAPAAAVAPKNGHRRHRVMLVDDEPLVAQTIERLLRRDYDITIALCGQEAIEQIARGIRFDAIVSDVMMPNMTGIELIEELRRVAPDQARRLIFLSGGAFTAQTRERLEELGAPQLEKPVTAKELRACVLRIATEPGATTAAAPGATGSAAASSTGSATGSATG